MRLILKTYLIQVKRRAQNLFKDQGALVGGVLFAVLSLAWVSALLVKELIHPAIEVMNDLESLPEITSLLSSFAFTCSGVVGVIALVKMVIADSQEDTYLRMLQNYGVSQWKRQSFLFIIDFFYLFALSIVVVFILFASSIPTLHQFKVDLIIIMALQLLGSSCMILAAVSLVQVGTRFIAHRWVGVGFVGASLYYGFKFVSKVHPLNMFAFVYVNQGPWFLLGLFIIILCFVAFVLSFNLEIKSQAKSYLLFACLPNWVLFKQMKETLRMKDFWFNAFLIAFLVCLVKTQRPGLLNDSMVLQIIVIIPSMLSIYTFAQMKDSVHLYRNVNILPIYIYLSGIISVIGIYMVFFLLMYAWIEPLGYVLIEQGFLLLLACSLFKLVGLIFPLHYRSSRNEQMIVAALSLLLLPVILILQELKKYVSLNMITSHFLYLILIIILNLIEYRFIKRSVYGS